MSKVKDDFISQFFGGGSDQDDGSEGYNSEDYRIYKGGRTPKRRKLDENRESGGSSSPSHASDGDEDQDVDEVGTRAGSNTPRPQKYQSTARDATPKAAAANSSKQVEGNHSPAAQEDEEGGAVAEEDRKSRQRPKTAPAASREEGEDEDCNPLTSQKGPRQSQPVPKPTTLARESACAALDAKKSGILYLSRIPPFMKPSKVRALLSPYGPLNRIYLSREDAESRKKRLRRGGNRKIFYIEGWVEFVRKSDAKKCCQLLNARPVGGKKAGFYHDDIWSMIYLKGFKWHHLVEQMGAEDREREARLEAELRKTKRENEAFLENTERAKVLEGMEKKRKKRKGKQGDVQAEEKLDVLAATPKAKVDLGIKKNRVLGAETKELISRIL